MRSMSFAAALVLLSFFSYAQISAPSTSEQLSEIAARGRAVSEYDYAAWHSSDAVVELKPKEKEFSGYVARKGQDGKWVVAFSPELGDISKDDSFEVVYPGMTFTLTSDRSRL